MFSALKGPTLVNYGELDSFPILSKYLWSKEKKALLDLHEKVKNWQPPKEDPEKQYKLEGAIFPKDRLLTKIKNILESKWNVPREQLEGMRRNKGEGPYVSQRPDVNPTQSRDSIALIPYLEQDWSETLMKYLGKHDEKGIKDLYKTVVNCAGSDYALEGVPFPRFVLLDQIVKHLKDKWNYGFKDLVTLDSWCRTNGKEPDVSLEPNANPAVFVQGEKCALIRSKGAEKLPAFAKEKNIDQACQSGATTMNLETAPELVDAGTLPTSKEKLNQQQNESITVPPVCKKPSTAETNDSEDPVFKSKRNVLKTVDIQTTVAKTRKRKPPSQRVVSNPPKRFSSQLEEPSSPVDGNDDEVQPIKIKPSGVCPSTEDLSLKLERKRKPNGRGNKTVAKKPEPVSKKTPQVERETGSNPTRGEEKTDVALKPRKQAKREIGITKRISARLGNTSASGKDGKRPAKSNVCYVYSSSDSDTEDSSRDLERKKNDLPPISSPHKDGVEENVPDARKGCPKCGKNKFSNRSSLKRHIQNCVNPKPPLECDYVDETTKKKCGKKYSRKDHLDDHFRTKHANNPGENWDCDECGKSFTIRDSFRKHKRRIHKSAAKPQQQQLA